MGNIISMTPDTMRSRATEYRTEADKVGDVISTMDTLLGELEDEWKGSASEAYSERYKELKPGFEKAQELINEIATALDSTAKIVEDTDTDISNQFKNQQ